MMGSTGVKGITSVLSGLGEGQTPLGEEQSRKKQELEALRIRMMRQSGRGLLQQNGDTTLG